MFYYHAGTLQQQELARRSHNRHLGRRPSLSLRMSPPYKSVMVASPIHSDVIFQPQVLPSLCWTSFYLIRRRFTTSPFPIGWLLTLDLICFLASATCCSLGMLISGFWSGGQECLIPTNDASNGLVSASCESLIHLAWGVETTAFAGAYLMA